jgi:hypothetical protein
MNGLEFGAYDEFYEEVFNFTSTELDSLNLTEVFEFVMLKCDEIFVGKCWWRNKVRLNLEASLLKKLREKVNLEKDFRKI